MNVELEKVDSHEDEYEDEYEEVHEVLIKDINMSFISMVIFLVKLSFAIIPALLIIWSIYLVLDSVFLEVMTSYVN